MKKILVFMLFLVTFTGYGQVTHYVDKIIQETDTIKIYISYDADSVWMVNDTTLQDWVSAHGGGSANISDAIYSSSWNGNTTDGASKNVLYDKINSDSTAVCDSLAVHRDSIDDISNYLHGLSQDFWPLSGDGLLTDSTYIQTGGNGLILATAPISFPFPPNQVGLYFSNSTFGNSGNDPGEIYFINDGTGSGFDIHNDYTVRWNGYNFSALNGVLFKYGDAYNFSSNLDIPDVGWTSTHLGTKSLSTIAQNPTATEDGKVLAWYNASNEWDTITVSSGGGSFWPLSGNFSTGGAQIITLGGQLILDVPDGDQLSWNNSSASSGFDYTSIAANRNVFDFVADSVGTTVHLSIGVDSTSFEDNRTVKRGIEYAESGYVTRPLSLATKEYVDNLVSTPDAASVTYTPTTTGDWPGTDPNDVEQALDDLADRFLGVRIDTIEIGVWDMNVSVDGAGTIDITVTGVPWNKIKSVQAWVRNDNNNTSYPITKANSGGSGFAGDIGYITGDTNAAIRLNVFSSGFFDDAAFDTDTGYNRGWVIVFYIE